MNFEDLTTLTTFGLTFVIPDDELGRQLRLLIAIVTVLTYCAILASPPSSGSSVVPGISFDEIVRNNYVVTVVIDPKDYSLLPLYPDFDSFLDEIERRKMDKLTKFPLGVYLIKDKSSVLAFLPDLPSYNIHLICLDTEITDVYPLVLVGNKAYRYTKGRGLPNTDAILYDSNTPVWINGAT